MLTKVWFWGFPCWGCQSAPGTPGPGRPRGGSILGSGGALPPPSPPPQVAASAALCTCLKEEEMMISDVHIFINVRTSLIWLDGFLLCFVLLCLVGSSNGSISVFSWLMKVINWSCHRCPVLCCVVITGVFPVFFYCQQVDTEEEVEKLLQLLHPLIIADHSIFCLNILAC